jgi:hypothetical protein
MVNCNTKIFNDVNNLNPEGVALNLKIMMIQIYATLGVAWFTTSSD